MKHLYVKHQILVSILALCFLSSSCKGIFSESGTISFEDDQEVEINGAKNSSRSNVQLASVRINNSTPTSSRTFNLSYGTVTGSPNSYCILENNSSLSNCAFVNGDLPDTYQVSATEGAKTLSIWIKNAKGKVSKVVKSNTVTLDTTAPELASASIDNASPSNTRIYYLSYGAVSDTYSSYCILENNADEEDCTYVSNTLPDSFEVSALENAKVLSIWLKDAAGNVGNRVVTNSVTYEDGGSDGGGGGGDGGAPTLASVTIDNASPTNSKTYDLSFGAVTGAYNRYCILENNTDQEDCAYVTAALPASFDVSATENAKVLSVWLRDSAGNTSPRVASNSVTLDTTEPKLASATIDNSTPTNTTTFDLSYGAVTGTYNRYCILENNTDEGDCAYVAAALPDSFEVDDTEEAKILSIWIKDAAGNISERVATNSVTLDITDFYSLTVSKSGTGTGTVSATGINCGNDCSESYDANTQVTLTASPSSSSIFSGWSAACTGTGTCSITMNQAKTVQAQFTLKTSTVRTTNKISQWGISWEFSNAHQYGTFVNGDYWVVGPVTIIRMTPEWNGTHNGWEVNPLVRHSQGFVSGQPGYTDDVRPAMPFSVTSGSIVKVISGDLGKTTVQTAAVLTVLSEAPPNDGADVFRPPYVGSDKPLYRVSDLRSDLLPSYPQVSGAPSLASIVESFSKCLRMDHHSSRARRFRPVDAMQNYQPKNTQDLNNAMLRLMLDDNYEDKLPALILFTQHALDRAYAVKLGYRRVDDGHNPNHRILAAWAATLLDIDDIKTYLKTASGFHEDRYLYQGVNAVLWGEPATEKQYWDYINGLGGSRSHKDPYDYIDGGMQSLSGAAYQNITSQSLKGQALVGRLFPELQAGFATGRWSNLSEYAERWVTLGTWTSPDPHDRFVSLHGSNADGGQYRSTFVASMWDAYAFADDYPVIEKPPTSNLLENHDFSWGLNYWENWGNSSVTGGELRVGTGDGGVGQNVISVLQANEYYHLEALARVAGGDDAWIGIKFHAANGTIIDQYSAKVTSTVYATTGLDFVVPPGAASAYVYYWKSATLSEYAYADNFKLIKIP